MELFRCFHVFIFFKRSSVFMFQASSEEEFQGMPVGKGRILKVIFVGEFFQDFARMFMSLFFLEAFRHHRLLEA